MSAERGSRLAFVHLVFGLAHKGSPQPAKGILPSSFPSLLCLDGKNFTAKDFVAGSHSRKRF